MGKFNFQRDWNFDQNNRLVDRDFLEGSTFDEVMQVYTPSLLVPGVDFREDLDGIMRQEIRNAGQYDPRQLMALAATDTPTVTTGQAADAAFNQQYVIAAGALPAIWPIDALGPATISSNNWSVKTSNPAVATVSTYRTVLDGPELFIFTYADANFTIDLFIDGRPYANNPITPLPSTGFAPFGFQKLVWGAAKESGRLLEFRMIGGFVGMYTKKPYSLRKPQPDRQPKIAVVGDSYVAPTVMQDAANAQVTSDGWLSGIYQRMGVELGLTSIVTDGISGTGYIAPGGANRPYGHAERLAWLQAVAPDVIVVHGGGANDIFTGSTDAQIIAAAVSYLTTLRANHPNAKLVFVEGFAPPGFTPGTYNPRYVAIRQGVQQALANAVDVYFISVASSNPPAINGTGFLGTPNASGNSDIYVGYDQIHLSRAGNRYVRGVIAAPLRRILADGGQLVGSLL